MSQQGERDDKDLEAYKDRIEEIVEKRRDLFDRLTNTCHSGRENDRTAIFSARVAGISEPDAYSRQCPMQRRS